MGKRNRKDLDVYKVPALMDRISELERENKELKLECEKMKSKNS